MRPFIYVFLLFTSILTVPPVFGDDTVTSSDITLVKISSVSGNGGSTTVSCFNSMPGTVRSKGDVLSFRSFSADIRRLRANGSSRRLTRKIQLRKRGRTACAEGSNKAKVPLTDAAIDPSTVALLALGNSTEVGIPLDSLQRADSVHTNATITDVVAALQSALSCATLNLSGGTLLIDFGTGCTVSGTTFSGSATASVSLSNGTLTISFSTTNLSAHGFTLNGSSAFGLEQGRLGINLDTDVTQSSVTTSLEFEGTVVDDDTGFTIDGSGEFSSASLTGEFTVTDLHKVQNGSCYPNSGTIVVTLDNAPSITVTFSETTTTTREVSVQIGTVTTTETLPECGT